MTPIADRTDLAVLKPFRLRGAPFDAMYHVRWLAGIPLRHAAAVLLLWPTVVLAQAGMAFGDSFAALWRWVPFLVTQGFLFNIIISLFSMLIGTALGVALGLAQISLSRPVRAVAWFLTQLFRNSPWLVLLFIVLLALPFEITILGQSVRIPAWMKAVFGLSLPIMANISEIVRGAVVSVPSGQWEASESLGFNRRQTLFEIILPQCFKRMIPPWMNWYAILTMATPLCSLLGVEEIITLSRQAMSAEDNQPELLVPFYGFALVLFFAYCYPIARATIWLERRVSVKL
jgi:polar amino acid transport system permease protein